MSGDVMTMCNPGYSVVDGTQYQVPPACAGAGVGATVIYGGSTYLIGARVMIKININAGYGTKPVPGQSGLNLTGRGTHA